MIGNNTRLPAREINSSSNSDVIVPPDEKVTAGSTVANKPMTPLYAFFVVMVAYFGLNWLQSTKMTESLKTGNIKANFHNILVVTIAAALGFAFFKVLFSKMAMMNIAPLRVIGEGGLTLFTDV